MKKSPLQQVRDEFGSKDKLAEKLIPLLDRHNDESDDVFARRIRTASNAKLLRLWRAEHAVKEQFGSRDKLVDAVVELKMGRADADYRASIDSLPKTRLLDLHRQLSN